MNRFYGKIGYAETVNTSPGVWEEKIAEKNYYINILRNTRKLQNTSQVNYDVNISNEFSILSDPYAIQNFHSMRYIEWMGCKWKIESVEVMFPRLVLSVGGLYHE
nr:MAG TPA: hypothetical protein [Caudoviricetes sp.]